MLDAIVYLDTCFKYLPFILDRNLEKEMEKIYMYEIYCTKLGVKRTGIRPTG